MSVVAVVEHDSEASNAAVDRWLDSDCALVVISGWLAVRLEVVASHNNVLISGTESTGVDGKNNLNLVVANVSESNDWASIKKRLEELATAVAECRSIERSDSKSVNPVVQILSKDLFLGKGNWERDEEVAAGALAGMDFEVRRQGKGLEGVRPAGSVEVESVLSDDCKCVGANSLEDEGVADQIIVFVAAVTIASSLFQVLSVCAHWDVELESKVVIRAVSSDE